MIESKVEATRFVVGGRELKKGRRKRIVMVTGYEQLLGLRREIRGHNLVFRIQCITSHHKPS